ncbi:MAG TPA: hypothetical protein VMD09_02910 [Solirubrobacteraceae bacterium]|nr:hypothetical protein [Solirubrobacteraceae bacterium]
MSALFVSYLWHYLAARTIYDEFLRPLTRGHPGSLLVLGLLIVGAFALGRLTAARSRR